nr:MAG TPA: YopX protein [Bacteriophage sp.]
MAIKPILFNAEMVRAILDGRKTCTRRLPRKQIEEKYLEYEEWVCAVAPPGSTWLSEKEFYEKYPPYQPGDILYVRETWHKYIKRVGNGESCHLAEFYGYKASIANSEDAAEPWRPSIHMPKDAARIWLKVTDVRVERLQDVTEDGAKAEGAIDNRGFIHSPENKHLDGTWVEGYLEDENHINDGKCEFLIDPETICQYTGLIDKNGKKIWENDILEGHLDDKFPEDVTREKVIWHESGWKTEEPGCVDKEYLDEFDTENFEVVGNVFDNPELLEV